MQTRIFGLPITNLGLTKTLAVIIQLLSSGQKHLIVTANPEILVCARQNQTYYKILKSASLLLPDGFGLILASFFTKTHLSMGRVSGVDFVEQIIANSVDRPYSIYLLGGSDDMLRGVIEKMKIKYGDVKIVGYHTGTYFDKYVNIQELDKDEQNIKVLADVSQKSPDILLVGFGHPKQEMWLSHYLERLPIKVGIGVGGSFDYLSENIIRAPKLLQSIGLEWLWRLFCQPRLRFKRIFNAVIVFPLLFLANIIGILPDTKQNVPRGTFL